MHGQAHIGERILHFGAIVEAKNHDEFERQTAPAEKPLETCVTGNSCDTQPRTFDPNRREDSLELTGDKFRFGLRIPRLEILEIRSRAFLRVLSDLPSRSGLLATTARPRREYSCVER